MCECVAKESAKRYCGAKRGVIDITSKTAVFLADMMPPCIALGNQETSLKLSDLEGVVLAVTDPSENIAERRSICLPNNHRCRLESEVAPADKGAVPS